MLGHSKGEADLSRASGGLPLLDNHQRWASVASQIGVVEDVRLDEDGVIRGLMRFSQRPEAQAIRQDVLDGIIRGVSIGYSIDQLKLVEEKKNGASTYRAVKWRLLEGSLVSVPADATVGVGRSADQDANATVTIDLDDAASRAEESNVEDEKTTAAPANGAAPTVTVGEERDERASRVEALTELAQVMSRDADLAKWIRSGKSVEAVKTELLAEANQNLERIRQPAVDMSPAEEKQYSLIRAVSAVINGSWKGAEFEREVSEECEKKLPSNYQRRGNFLVPGNIGLGGTRTALAAGTANAADDVVFTEPGSFIELLRNRMKVKELGATMLSGLRGPVAFPKQATAGSVAWLGESAAVTESNLTTTQVLLNPKTLRARQAYTKQLFNEAVVDVEALIRADLASIMALEVDRVAIEGDGSSNSPTGILSTSGIGSVALGTNGAAPAFGDIVDLETEIAQDNADIASMAYLTTAGMRGQLKKTEQFSSTNGQPVWTGGREGEMNGYPAHVSNQVPSDLTKGTGTGLHAILFGVFSQLMIGEWGVLEVQVDPYTRADEGEVVLRTFQMVGLAVRHAQAFAAITDASVS